jgi:hypothetical protein
MQVLKGDWEFNVYSDYNSAVSYTENIYSAFSNSKICMSAINCEFFHHACPLSLLPQQSMTGYLPMDISDFYFMYFMSSAHINACMYYFGNFNTCMFKLIKLQRGPKKCIHPVVPPFSLTLLPFDKVALAFMLLSTTFWENITLHTIHYISVQLCSCVGK